MNNKRDIISIIVPVYKAERYLEACINSILAQSYTQLEIILVNDGSPDDSGKLCDILAQKDVRIKVIHKQNGGAGSARNVALEIAEGKFVAFVDSDDTLDIDMYEKLYKRMIETEADICVCGYKTIYEDYTRIERVPTESTLSSAQIWERYLANFRRYFTVFSAPWNKLLKMSLIQGSIDGTYEKIRFPEELLRSQDIWFNADCIAASKNGIAFLDTAPYNYNLTNNPKVMNKTGLEYIIKAIDHNIESMLDALPHRAEEIKNLKKCQHSVSLSLAVHGAIINKSESKFKLKWRDIATILRYSTSIPEKGSALAMYFLPNWMYRMLFKLYCKVTLLS